ncbi:MAG: penicillin-binding protein 1C [bacterium]
MKHLKWPLYILCILFITLVMFTISTFIFSIKPLPKTLTNIKNGPIYANVLDRSGYQLSFTKQNTLNHTPLPLWKIPEILSNAFILAEDRRFYDHHGLDWLARGMAIIANIKACKIVRGASTITEQCIRIIHPRPRTFYTRWIETIEAYLLEKKFTKADILEFYLNQVPFSHQCRGVSQASNFYFGRTLDTLNIQEMIGLAIMVRAPSFFSNNKNKKELEKRIIQLAQVMKEKRLISGDKIKEISLLKTNLGLSMIGPRVGAPHFIQYLKKNFKKEITSRSQLITTIDSNLQTKLYYLLKETLKKLKRQEVNNGAILVLDHQTDEILAWVNGDDFFSSKTGSQIDTILALRQPGSTLKPFLYALALEKGLTTSTIIPDIPIVQPIGNGLHSFTNYSKSNYGPIRLRCALGNSLNIPAIRTIYQVGVPQFLDLLHELGFQSLNERPAYYGVGLALGNGEVSLFELVNAYSVLARGGTHYTPKFFLSDHNKSEPTKKILSSEACSLIANILADPYAHTLEFGESGILNFPVQTAVKTGTSTDYRDSWAVGFNYKYTIGVWMGNLNYDPTVEITGSRGPALILRAVFNELNKHKETQPLYFNRTLVSRDICALSGKLVSPSCPQIITEWYKKEETPTDTCNWHQKEGHPLTTHLPYIYKEWITGNKDDLEPALDLQPNEHVVIANNSFQKNDIKKEKQVVKMIQPVQNLHLALDPRIPDDLERFPFKVESRYPIEKIEWLLDRSLLATTGIDINQYLWLPQKGTHKFQAKITLLNNMETYKTPEIDFWVR